MYGIYSWESELMDKSMQIKILQARKKSGKPFSLTVTGISMNSALYEGDIVTVIPAATYEIGDILVFCYEQDELLIHRLIDIKDELYCCKGDNALRIERIASDQIIGKVIEVSRNGQSVELRLCTNKFFVLSKAVDKVFFKCRYDPIKTRETYIYKLYEKVIVKMEEAEVYMKNEKMDYIDSDDNTIAVFDPDSGDTHFLDETGTDIIKILEQPCEFERIISELCEIYDATPEDIRDDVREFLNDAVAKGIVVEL